MELDKLKYILTTGYNKAKTFFMGSYAELEQVPLIERSDLLDLNDDFIAIVTDIKLTFIQQLDVYIIREIELALKLNDLVMKDMSQELIALSKLIENKVIENYFINLLGYYPNYKVILSAMYDKDKENKQDIMQIHKVRLSQELEEKLFNRSQNNTKLVKYK